MAIGGRLHPRSAPAGESLAAAACGARPRLQPLSEPGRAWAVPALGGGDEEPGLGSSDLGRDTLCSCRPARRGFRGILHRARGDSPRRPADHRAKRGADRRLSRLPPPLSLTKRVLVILSTSRESTRIWRKSWTRTKRSPLRFAVARSRPHGGW